MEPKILWPVDGQFPITFRFGEAPAWYTRIFGYPHNGLDIGCPIGSGCRATDDGKVSFCDDIPDSNGKGIIITHSWGISLYWHLSRLTATLGEAVSKGQFIGNSGATGYVTGPHLHFAVKVNGVNNEGMRGWADPSKYFTENPPAIPAPALQTRYHLVFPGDTLWSLAQKYYKNGLEWRRIWDANKNTIPNPNLIRPFQRLLIP